MIGTRVPATRMLPIAGPPTSGPGQRSCTLPASMTLGTSPNRGFTHTVSSDLAA